jgi:hypothetical protein
MQKFEVPSVAYFVADLDDLEDPTLQGRPSAPGTTRRRHSRAGLSSLRRSARRVLSTVVALFLPA